MSAHHEQDDLYAVPLVLHWSRLGGDVHVRYDGPRDVWMGTFEDGTEYRVSGRDIRFVGQRPENYFHHERFLRSLRPAA